MRLVVCAFVNLSTFPKNLEFFPPKVDVNVNLNFSGPSFHNLTYIFRYVSVNLLFNKFSYRI
jgi:hypothetical protein